MNSAKTSAIRKPVIEHLNELRSRFVWCALALIAAGGLGFSLHEKLLALIQRPLGESLYYTSPTGGFNFIFKLSLTFGLIVALPVVFYHAIKFLSPLLDRSSKIRILNYTAWSVILAYAGVLFAYFVSLPAALKFLIDFGGTDIQALINANEYFNFALAYIAGFAVLFQIPLLMLFINRINRQKPGKLMRAQRFIILGSFIVAAILTPTPDPFNQLIMALPMVVLYQVGIILIWLVNRGAEPVRHASNTVKVPVSEAVRPAQSQRPRMAMPATGSVRRSFDIVPQRSVRTAMPMRPSVTLMPARRIMDIAR